ncbi:MAG: PadR family transcriptional regulator [bacterium]|nr:PadR family transcriptional regulator [bacterium]
MGYVILGLLILQPNTLYGISKAFEGAISLIYSASLGGIRSALMRLEESGWIEPTEHVEGGRNKKTYTVTDAGREEFERWIRAIPERGDLEREALSRVLFLGLLPEEERGIVLAELTARARHQLAAVEAQAAESEGLEFPPEVAEVARYQVAMLEYARLTLRAVLTWLEGLR